MIFFLVDIVIKLVFLMRAAALDGSIGPWCLGYDRCSVEFIDWHWMDLL